MNLLKLWYCWRLKAIKTKVVSAFTELEKARRNHAWSVDEVWEHGAFLNVIDKRNKHVLALKKFRKLHDLCIKNNYILE